MKWSESDIAYLCAYYPGRPTHEVAKGLGRTYSATSQKARNLGLTKTDEYLSSESAGRHNLIEGGKKHRFTKGHKTWNKGLSWDSGGRSSETRFKPGDKPQTWQPVGTERKNKDGLLERKVSDTGVNREDWRPVHVLEWERHNGTVPGGCIVVFKNRDRDDIRIENLECITRAENMRRNSYLRYPKEVADAIRMRGALNRKIKERLRNEKHDG